MYQKDRPDLKKVATKTNDVEVDVGPLEACMHRGLQCYCTHLLLVDLASAMRSSRLVGCDWDATQRCRRIRSRRWNTVNREFPCGLGPQGKAVRLDSR